MKFSATLDEWTSTSVQRFLNINIHFTVLGGKTGYINLGLMEILGSCPADIMAQMVRKSLKLRAVFVNYVRFFSNFLKPLDNFLVHQTFEKVWS